MLFAVTISSVISGACFRGRPILCADVVQCWLMLQSVLSVLADISISWVFPFVARCFWLNTDSVGGKWVVLSLLFVGIILIVRRWRSLLSFGTC